MTYAVHPRAELDLAEASDFYMKQAGKVVAYRVAQSAKQQKARQKRARPESAEA